MKTFILILVYMILVVISIGQVKNKIDDDRQIKIPIVFHVVYNAQTDNVCDSLILKELNDLNLDFSQRNDMYLLDTGFREVVGNPNILFYLFDSLFQKGGMKGVRRIRRTNLVNMDEFLIRPSLCLNVFIANHGNASDILSDRVNLFHEDVGLSSHVLTHETGHWLGLYHIFGKVGNDSRLNRLFGDKDDLIDDTPEQKGATARCYVSHRPTLVCLS